MLRSDANEWKRPYVGAVDGPAEPRLSAHTGIPLSAATRLGDEILADLSPSVFGVAWWENDLPSRERILVSDHLLACARAIPENLLEAQVGLLDFREASNEYDTLMQRGVHRNGDFRLPPPRGPYDDLLPVWEQAAIAGMVRALGSALDCLGACIVGVAALPTDIVRADLGKARLAMKKEAGPAEEVSGVAAVLDSAIESAGPSGWLDWLIATRNMVVHRGRRITAMNGDIKRSPGASSATIELVRVLNSDPGLTEVDAWLAHGGYFSTLLKEPAETTLRGCLLSTATAIESTCACLIDLWQLRRAQPNRIRQPEAQCAPPKSRPIESFRGYAPDPSLLDAVTGVAVADETGLRLAAAGLSDHGRVKG
jgi:hypothetical protein